MTNSSFRRAKLVLFPTKPRPPTPGLSEDDFAVYASYRPDSSGRFVGTLKVVRLTDGRLLFPFEGAEEIGPFDSKEAAEEAASLRGSQIVEADLLAPEL